MHNAFPSLTGNNFWLMIIKPAIPALFLCLPVTGFIYGFLHCSDCKMTLEGLGDRLLLGAIQAFFTSVSLGKAYNGVASPVNLQGWALLTFFALWVIFWFYRMRKKRIEDLKS